MCVFFDESSMMFLFIFPCSVLSGGRDKEGTILIHDIAPQAVELPTQPAHSAGQRGGVAPYHPIIARATIRLVRPLLELAREGVWFPTTPSLLPQVTLIVPDREGVWSPTTPS